MSRENVNFLSIYVRIFLIATIMVAIFKHAPAKAVEAMPQRTMSSGGKLENSLIPSVTVGVRTGKEDGSKITQATVGVKVHHTELQMGPSKLSLAAPGFAVQGDGKMVFNVSPASVLFKDKYAISLDYYPKPTNNAGAVGVSVGLSFD